MKYGYLFFVVLLGINYVRAMEQNALVRYLQEGNQEVARLLDVCRVLDQDNAKTSAMLAQLRGLVRAQVPSRGKP